MSRHDRPRGIGGERFSTEPVGAVLRIGKKNDRGVPIERDRFYIALPHEDSSGHRPLHPRFNAFNVAPPEHRTFVSGNLVHGSLRDAFDLQRYAYRLPKPAFQPPPSRRPACEGDGMQAIRYLGDGKRADDEEFRSIPCPGDLCEFAQAGICKVRLTILFRPRWAEGAKLPAPLMRFASHAEHNLSSVYGLFDHVADVAHSLRILDAKPPETQGYAALEEAGVPMFGLPFSMTLTERTNPEKRTKFPVVKFAPDGDLVAWLMGVVQQREQLGAARETLLLSPIPASVADDPDEVIDVDHQELSVEEESAQPATDSPTAPPAPAGPQPAPLSAEAKDRIARAAAAKGLDIDDIEDLIEAPLSDLTADDERPLLDRIELLPAKGSKR